MDGFSWIGCSGEQVYIRCMWCGAGGKHVDDENLERKPLPNQRQMEIGSRCHLYQLDKA